MAGADLRIFGDAAGLARAAAGAAGRVLAAAARAHGSASIALAGGNTPRDLYRRLALAHGADVPWRKVHVFWGDERDVPPDDPASNYRMARECLQQAPLRGGQLDGFYASVDRLRRQVNDDVAEGDAGRA